jgi:uncharacterized membrane protein YfhO
VLYVDKIESKLERTADLFMSSNVTDGEHEFELVFVPFGLKVGKYLSLLGLFILFISIRIPNFKSKP